MAHRKPRHARSEDDRTLGEPTQRPRRRTSHDDDLRSDEPTQRPRRRTSHDDDRTQNVPEPRFISPQEKRRVRMRPHLRKGDRVAEVLSIVRSPMFAYASAAIVLTALLFALTIPIDTYDPEQATSAATISDVKPHPENDEYVEP